MNYAIILAGGQGVRMGKATTPKQFIELDNRPLIQYSFETAEKNKNIDAVCVACPKSWHRQVEIWAKPFSKVQIITESGQNRQQTVHRALKALPAAADDIVMIMTAVCPFVSQKTVDSNFEMLEKHDASITVIKATDAITFSSDGKRVNRTMQKKKMFIQQGPQTFRYGVIKTGHESYESREDRTEVNEDSELVLDMGVDVGMVLGDRYCIKVTYPEDLKIAESLKAFFVESEANNGV